MNSVVRIIGEISRGRFRTLLLVLLLMLSIEPFLKDLLKINFLLDIFMTLALLAGVVAVSEKKHQVVIASTLSVPVIVATWSMYLYPGQALLFIVATCGALYFGYVLSVVFAFLVREKEVTVDVISAAVVVYLLLGIFWAMLYSLLEVVSPGSFNVGSLPEGGKIIEQFIYYSFVTLTTLGYGDITPLVQSARSLSVLEAIIGQIYLTVLVARLVGIHITQSLKQES